MSGTLEKLIEALEANTAVMEKLLEESDSPATPEKTKRAAKKAEDDDGEDEAPAKKAPAKKAPAKKRATKDDLVNALKEHSEAFGKAETKRLLAEFNVSNPKDLNSAQYGKVIEAANAELNATGEEGDDDDDDFDF